MSDEAPLVEIDGLSKTFRLGFFRRRVEAIRDLSFGVRRGEIFGLLGPNGAGKTTTLKVLMGLIFADSGTARIEGIDCRRPAARRRVGFLPENPYFHEYLTPRELLGFYGRLVGLPAGRIAAQSQELIERVGLSGSASRPLRKFSKGMLQRIGLAQALIGDPNLLVLDEPMSGLDPIGRKQVADLIEQLNRAGMTVVFSSHILSDVERLCDRVVILRDGRKVAEGDLDELVGERSGVESLESLFIREAVGDPDGEKAG